MSAQPRVLRAGTLALALAAGCGPAASPSAEVVDVRGVVFTDIRVEATCAQQPALSELSGVVLTFLDPGGAVLAQATTGAVQGEDLPAGPGMVGWTAFGCRYFAPYHLALPPAEAYEVRFTPNAADAASSFQGIELLEPQRIRREELERLGFQWSFEAEPTYVVP